MDGPQEFGRGHTLASVLDEVWCDNGDNRLEADRELAADFFNDSEVGRNPSSQPFSKPGRTLLKIPISVVHRI